LTNGQVISGRLQMSRSAIDSRSSAPCAAKDSRMERRFVAAMRIFGPSPRADRATMLSKAPLIVLMSAHPDRPLIIPPRDCFLPGRLSGLRFRITFRSTGLPLSLQNATTRKNLASGPSYARAIASYPNRRVCRIQCARVRVLIVQRYLLNDNIIIRLGKFRININ